MSNGNPGVKFPTRMQLVREDRLDSIMQGKPFSHNPGVMFPTHEEMADADEVQERRKSRGGL